MSLSREFLNFSFCEYGCEHHLKMLKDILSYREKYEKLKQDPREMLDLEKHMSTLFLVDVQQTEDIGVGDYAKTRDVLDNMNNESCQETLNLIKAWQLITGEVSQAGSDLGFLEIDHFMLGIHKILMTGLIANAGEMSTDIRFSNYANQTHVYPRFINRDLAYETLITLVDKHNAITSELKALPESADKIAGFFKSASLLLCALLNLHFFSDGNGRWSKFITAYVLLQVSPFYTGCCTSRESYLSRLLSKKQNLPVEVNSIDEARYLGVTVLRHEPTEICSMLIESSHYLWNHLFERVTGMT